MPKEYGLKQCDRIPTNHPSSDVSSYPGNSRLARPLAQSRSLHEVATKSRLKTWPRLMLPSLMNAGIYMNEACTLFDYAK